MGALLHFVTPTSLLTAFTRTAWCATFDQQSGNLFFAFSSCLFPCITFSITENASFIFRSTVGFITVWAVNSTCSFVFVEFLSILADLTHTLIVRTISGAARVALQACCLVFIERVAIDALGTTGQTG